MALSEELRLTVSVDDQATAQLQGLRGQLTSMGGGAQAAGMERVRRQSVEVGRGFAGLSQELSQFATRAGVIGGVVGAITGKLTDLGLNFINRVTDVKGMSDAIVNLNKNAALMGATPAQLQAVTDWFGKSGQSADDAKASFAGVQSVIGELQRPGSPANQFVLRQRFERPEQGEEFRARVTQIAEADPAQRLSLIRRGYEDIVKTVTSLHGAERGLLAGREWLDFWRAPGLANVTGEIGKVSEAQNQLQKDRLADAQEISEAQNQTTSNWGRMATAAGQMLQRIIPIKDNMVGIKDDTGTWADSLERGERALREAGGLINWIKQNVPIPKVFTEAPGAPPPTETDQRTQEQKDAEARRLAEEKAAQAARELAAQAAGIPQAGAVPAIPPPIMPPLRPLRPRRPALPIPEGTLLDEAEQGRLDAEAAAVGAAQEARDAAAAAATRRLLPRRGREQPPMTETIPPASPQAAKPEWGWMDWWYGKPDAQAQPPAATAPQRFLGGPQPPAGSQPRPQPQTPAGPQPQPQLQPAEGRAFDVPAIGDLLKAIAGGGITAPPTPPALPPITVTPPPPSVVVSPPSQPRPIIVPFAERFGDWPQPQPAPATVEPSRGRELEPLDSRRAPPPSAFEGGRIGMMGGAGMDLGQAGQALDGRALDRAAARDINVNGSGKISVDVRAPAGTHVGAQAQGLFKTVSIARQTQMFPAESGPIPETGIGAAAGQLGS